MQRKWTAAIAMVVIIAIVGTAYNENLLIFEEDEKNDDDNNGSDGFPTDDDSQSPDDDQNDGDDDGSDPDGSGDNDTKPTFMEFPYDDIRTFQSLDPETLEPTGDNQWAIFDVDYGGNSFEHYLATTESGWIVNIGGDFPYWSKDRGQTWDSYKPPIPQGGGEGAVITTPDGDIVGMTWLGMYGDEFVAYYYDSSSDEWSWQYNRAHSAFYDRPWITIIPGPITTPAGTFPWASLVASNANSNYGVGYVISTDGLNYVPLNQPQLLLTEEIFDLEFDPSTEFDFLTPHREIDATPLPIGGLLVPRWNDNFNAYLRTDLTWVRHASTTGIPLPADHLVIDSTGALHSIEVNGNTLTYYLSLDGGLNWDSNQYSWPDGLEIEEWEFQADGEHELAVIYLRVQEADVDTDIIYHIRGYRDSMKADSITLVGLGDVDTTSGVASSTRFDFASLAILPDGGVVVAFRDSSPNPPHIAIELEMPYEDNPFIIS